MKRREFPSVWHALCIAMVAAALVAWGCTSAGGTTGATARVARTDANKFSPTSASVCLQQMIKSAPGPFHLSFAEKSSAQEASSVEADVTPLTIDYTKRETSAGQTSTSTKHLARAQLSDMEVDFDMMGPVPWHGELVAAQDATKLAGAETVNDYSAIKYSIETANEPAAKKATFESLMAVKDFADGGEGLKNREDGLGHRRYRCLVKSTIDPKQDAKNGSVERTHFEGDVTKK